MTAKPFAALTAAALLAAGSAALVAAAPSWRGHTSTLAVISGDGDVAVAGMPGRTGVLRLRYAVPVSWKRLTTVNATRIRFDTKNSCGHRVTVSGRLAVGPDVPAAQRLDTLLPRSRGTVRTAGTRDTAAFRVLRVRGTASVAGVLVQPLPLSFSRVPAGQRLYAELRGDATADPKRECHAGGPRTVGDALGDAFAAGRAGGFLPSS
jgi:hypothetical protein